MPDSKLGLDSNLSGRQTSSRQIKYTPWLGMVLGMCLALACTRTYLSERELQAYIQESEGLSKTKEYKGYQITVSYKPNDLLIAQELGGEQAKSFTQLTELKKKYQDYNYFILSLSKENKEALYKGGGGYDQFSDLVQTLSFRMGNYVNMTTSGSDTIEVADYVFPRTYGMGTATNLMFVFNKKNTEDDEWMQFNIKEFGMGLGNKTFRFRRADLEHVPKIDFTVKK
ncbi:MAG: hypothetical protein AAF149_13240 [Bacteroidota bacterium]